MATKKRKTDKDMTVVPSGQPRPMNMSKHPKPGLSPQQKSARTRAKNKKAKEAAEKAAAKKRDQAKKLAAKKRAAKKKGKK